MSLRGDENATSVLAEIADPDDDTDGTRTIDEVPL